MGYWELSITNKIDNKNDNLCVLCNLLAVLFFFCLVGMPSLIHGSAVCVCVSPNLVMSCRWLPDIVSILLALPGISSATV